jgi:hypothetical protein
MRISRQSVYNRVVQKLQFLNNPSIKIYRFNVLDISAVLRGNGDIEKKFIFG